MKNGFFSRLGTALARLRGTLDAGPGNTTGEPMSVAGHLVFAPADVHASDDKNI
jgi:hypothetical protein